MVIILGLGTGMILLSCNNNVESPNNKGESKKEYQEENRINGYSDLEKLSKSVFYSIKHNDYEGVARHIISKKEAEKMLELWDVDEDRKKEAIEDIDEGLKANIADIRKGFDEIREYGANAGIVWSKTDFQEISYRIRYEDKVESAYVNVKFDYNELIYSFVYDCKKVDDIWRIFSTLSYND